MVACTNFNKAHAALLTANMCFSGWHLVGSLAMKDGANPFVFVLYREVFASILMYAVAKIRGQAIRVDKQDHKTFFALGLCSFLNVVGAMLALRYISATRFAIFQPLIPCIAAFISITIRLEKFTWIKCIGICIAVAGAIVAEAWHTGSDSGDKELNVPLGSIICCLQVTGMACLIVFQKKLLSKYESTVLTCIYYSIGSVITFIMCIGVVVVWYITGWGMEMTGNDLAFNFELLLWLALLYAATVATLFPYNAYAYATKILPPSITTVYCTFQPVGTIMLSYIVLQVIVSIPQGLGAALVIIGLIVTVYGQQKEAQVDEGNRKYSDSDFGSIDTDPFITASSFNESRDMDESNSSGLLSEGNLSALNAQFVHNPAATATGGSDVRKSRDTEEGTEKTVAWKTSPGRTAIHRV